MKYAKNREPVRKTTCCQLYDKRIDAQGPCNHACLRRCSNVQLTGYQLTAITHGNKSGFKWEVIGISVFFFSYIFILRTEHIDK